MKSLVKLGVLLILFEAVHGATTFTEYGYWGEWSDYEKIDGYWICGA